ncbi:MAG TPA: hypothetical protein VGP93_19375 [Polyangiaceae bacterium]|nr:hypothetical protein [Polyangiaceae bacterium]
MGLHGVGELPVFILAYTNALHERALPFKATRERGRKLDHGNGARYEALRQMIIKQRSRAQAKRAIVLEHVDDQACVDHPHDTHLRSPARNSLIQSAVPVFLRRVERHPHQSALVMAVGPESPETNTEIGEAYVLNDGRRLDRFDRLVSAWAHVGEQKWRD